jgi:hypothetical protein
MITVNMEKAKDIHRDRIRNKRKSLFDSLDVAFMRAVEAGDAEKQKEIALKKQLLRDAPDHPGIINAKTPEELKSIDPLKNII